MDAGSCLGLVLSSGNILTKSVTWKKGSGGPANQEVYESLKACIGDDSRALEKAGLIEVSVDDESSSEENVDREELKISLKVFLSSQDKGDLITAVEKGLQLTGTEALDSLVVTFSGHSEGDSVSLNSLKAAWLVLEDFVGSGKVRVIGLSDVETQLFMQLHQWASVKPGIIQINLASCCVVPPELAEFCKKEGIQLLTHSDPINALSTEQLSLLVQQLSTVETLKSYSFPADAWNLKWVVRYQVHLKCRGVLSTKGYSAWIGFSSAGN